MEWLIATGADVNHTRPRDGPTAVYVAAQNGHLDVVSWLISAGADVDIIHNKAPRRYTLQHNRGAWMCLGGWSLRARTLT